MRNIKITTEQQIEIYNLLNARHSVTEDGVSGFLSFRQIMEISEIIKG